MGIFATEGNQGETPTVDIAIKDSVTKPETSATSPVPCGKKLTSTRPTDSVGEPDIPDYHFPQPGPSGISTSGKTSIGSVSTSDIRRISKMKRKKDAAAILPSSHRVNP
ncbi:hypothetical protein FQA39_LY08193 [Lamprigera yunnana]|nr:hypothetical protein FQA39_LY08193 [Lamprigera yunnana]